MGDAQTVIWNLDKPQSSMPDDEQFQRNVERLDELIREFVVPANEETAE